LGSTEILIFFSVAGYEYVGINVREIEATQHGDRVQFDPDMLNQLCDEK